MRVTNSMMTSRLLLNLNHNLRRMEKHQEKIATGKNFNMPSDNPVGVMKSLELTTAVAELEQHKKNTEDALSWLQITETAVEDIQNIIHRAKELTTQLSNGTYSDDDRLAGKQEIDQLKDQIVKIANTTYAGKHIFSGYKTDKKLLDSNGQYMISSNNNEIMEYEVGIKDKIDINVLGHKLFGTTTGPAYANLDNSLVDTSPATTSNESQLVAVFKNLSDALSLPSDQSKIMKATDRLDTHLNNVLQIRGELGAKTNRLELTLNRIEKENINFTSLLSKNEDADMTEVIMQFKNDENVYRASLSTGSKVIQPTLVDFIR